MNTAHTPPGTADAVLVFRAGGLENPAAGYAEELYTRENKLERCQLTSVLSNDPVICIHFFISFFGFSFAFPFFFVCGCRKG